MNMQRLVRRYHAAWCFAVSSRIVGTNPVGTSMTECCLVFSGGFFLRLGFIMGQHFFHTFEIPAWWEFTLFHFSFFFTFVGNIQLSKLPPLGPVLTPFRFSNLAFLHSIMYDSTLSIGKYSSFKCLSTRLHYRQNLPLMVSPHEQSVQSYLMTAYRLKLSEPGLSEVS